MGGGGRTPCSQSPVFPGSTQRERAACLSAMARLFLLDGMALVYRAHFALMRNPIRNSAGVNTSALYGFTNTLLTLIEKERPHHLGVAFDTSAPTPRHELYPEYKAQREDMPEELAAAIPAVKRLCHAFGIPILEIDGYEADDLIGTLAKRASAEGYETYMVTPDKDFAQLIDERTFMWRPGKRGADHEVIGPAELSSLWGVERPEQIIDLLGMMGDASDNIPGIPGVGPKTAQKLIATYGSLENLLDHTADLKGKQREKVEQNADLARMSKQLATILIDAPVEATWADLEVGERDDDAIRAIFDEFEFRTLSQRLFGESVGRASGDGDEAETFATLADTDHDYRLADTPETRAELLAELADAAAFCFDVETTSLDRFAARLLGIAFSTDAHRGWYWPYDPEALADFRPILTGPAEKIGHNLKYDLSILARHDLEIRGPYFDTMLAHALVHPDAKHTMDYLSETLLGYRPVALADLVPPTEAETEAADDDLFAHAAKIQAGKGKNKPLDVAAIPTEKLAEYAAEDADVTWQLAARLRDELGAANLRRVFDDIESPLLPVLVRMEMTGIRVDRDALGDIAKVLQGRMDELADRIRAHAGRAFNLNSPKQLGEILFDELALSDKPKKTRTGQYKTDEQTLATLRGKHPIIDEILEYREAAKLKSTYVDALPDHIQAATGRVHTHFHQLIAATGRLASSDPNLQNIPIRTTAGREVRRAFVPAEGRTLLCCDYSQIELRIMAALAADESMIQAFRDGRDIHTATAAKVWKVAESEVTREQRGGAKMVNFGIIYGISPFGLSQRLAIPRADAAELIDNYFAEYPAVRAYMDRTIEEARERGYVETLGGRRRFFPDLRSSNQTIRGNAERAAINTPIQGTAADMIKLAMIRVDALLRDKPYQTRMLLQVHDELVFDLDPAEEDKLLPQITELMESALPLPGGVPVAVESGTGEHWLAAH
jgi:DNA polymerase-1